LKPDGEILFYKGNEINDMQVFNKYKIMDFSHPAIGVRNIIQIRKKWEGYE